MVAETIGEGHLTGVFKGYAFDRLFALPDGSHWRPACETREYVYRERPAARLVREPSTKPAPRLACCGARSRGEPAGVLGV